MRVSKDIVNEFAVKGQRLLDRMRELYPDNTVLNDVSQFTAGHLHDLWFRVWASVNYPDSNPNVVRDANGNRLFTHDETYELYPNDSNDTTLLTALKRAAKQMA